MEMKVVRFILVKHEICRVKTNLEFGAVLYMLYTFINYH